MRLGLIATDLDGTLLRSDGAISLRTVEVLRQVIAADIPVVPVTARPLRWLEQPPFVALAGQLTHVVFGNGAVTYDALAGVVMSRHELLPDVVADLCKRITVAVPEAVFAIEADDGRTMWHEPHYPLRSDLGKPGVFPADRDDLLRRPVNKLLVKAPAIAPDELVMAVAAAAGGDAETSLSAGYGLVELAPPGITKASGLAEIAAAVGVTPGEVVAFGDMPNDLPMLQWAGRGVAVGNAHLRVRAAADEIAGSNDDDGVAQWLVSALML